MAFVTCTKLAAELLLKQDALVDCNGAPIPAGTAVALCSDIPPEVNVSDESVDTGAAAVTDLNFVGAGVTASQVGGVVTVTIPGAIGGLTTVATDSPITGNGTPGNPLDIDCVALKADCNLVSQGDIIEGDGIDITYLGDNITITNTGLTNVAAGGLITGDGTTANPLTVTCATIKASCDFVQQSDIEAGPGIIVTNLGDVITITNSGAPGGGITAVAVTAPITGDGTSLNPLAINCAALKAGCDLVSQSDLVPGTGITFNTVGDQITINATGVAVPAATDTIPGIASLAVGANYPSISDTEATTPLYVQFAVNRAWYFRAQI